MSGKEATVYIVDCGASMGETANGRGQRHLDWALEYVWDKITSTVATGHKTKLVGVVGLRTGGSRNELDSEDEYKHITVFQDLAQILMPQLRQLREDLQPNSCSTGDAISALVIAIQMIAQTCKKLQYTRRIVLVTDAKAPMDVEALSQITDKIKEDKIELTVLGVDFDDPEYGFKEESKDPVKADNEAILKNLCDACDGIFGTLAQAIEELEIPRMKSVRSVHSYKGFLTLGNAEEYNTALTIDVERYPKVQPAHPQSASKFVVRSNMSAFQQTQSSATLTDDSGVPDSGLGGIQSARSYQVKDDNAPGGVKDVSFEELAKGYEYGRTAVHISESDRNVTTYETRAGLDIIGFVEKHKFCKYLEMSKSGMTIANRSNEKASMALSSLIHALYEVESYAVARFVAKENREPKILLLAPNVEPDFECLFDVELPFAEDVRSYKFPPLDKVITVSGKTLEVHRNLPSDDLQSAMNSYVDSMDLSSFEKDEEGREVEYGSFDDIFSPMLHRVNQVIKHRAIHSDSEPPQPYNILTKYSEPPAELVEKAQRQLDDAIKAANVKKVPMKARGKRFGRKNREEIKPLSDLDVGALLANDSERQSKHIDPKNAIPEFKQIIATAEEISEVRSACQQLKNIIFDWVRHSVGESGYGKAVEATRVMREEMLEMEEPELFNDFEKEFKSQLLGGNLNGDRKEMWWRLRVNKIGLITKREVDSSNVTEDGSKAFMAAR